VLTDDDGRSGHGGTLAEIAARYGPRATITTGLGRVQDALETDPDLAASLIAELWQIADSDGDEFLRGEVLDLQVQSLRMRADRLGVLAPAGRRRWWRSVRAHCQRQTGSGGTGKQPAEPGDPLVMLGIAADMLEHGDRSRGRELVHTATSLNRAHPGTASTLQMYLVGKLYRAEAADDERASQFRDALENYVQAAGVFSCCAFHARAMTCLRHAEHLAAQDSRTAESAIRALAGAGLVLQRQLGAEAMTLIADMLRTSSGPFGTHLLPDIALLREQVAKGLLFSAALADPQPVHVDDQGETLLRRVAALGPVGVPQAVRAALAVPDEALLTSLVASAEMTAGETAVQRWMNLQRSFDEHLTASLYTAADESVFFNLDELRACLPPDTVFISLFIGVTPGADFAASHAQVVTAESYEYAMTRLPLPAAPVSRDVDGVTITYSIVAGLVTHLRRQIQEDPMFDDVDPEAASHLKLLNAWLGRFSGQVREWREAGYRHLVIWPHGPTHYLPWHLYRAADESVPLADHWTVTVVPAIGMLGRPAAPAGTGMVSVGCGKAGVAYGLPAVAELPPQAQRLAQVFGTTALPEGEATPTRVAQALPRSRYVHIATHASQLAHAPAFQCLYLTPGDDGEGRLFAYQIAALDLRGVQLVTLCACESGLGRFDAGDNLRGLSAAFLAAGASSVIAALWPVAAGPASSFFSSLYKNIGSGHSAVSAFKEAQLETRQIHREYRDWGAFAFIGDWRV
jgi:hypothetical protein